MEVHNIIFKTVVGSHAYGTNIEGSDKDIKGIYIQDPIEVLNYGYQEQVTVNKDEVYYELRRFIDLCCGGNPTMLELLFSPEDCIIEKNPIFDMLLEHKEKFLSKSCRHSFSGYAFSQITKAKGLDKKMNWENQRCERKTPLDFCYILTPLGSTPLKDWLHYQRKWEEQHQQFYGVTKTPNCRDMYQIFPKARNKEVVYRGIINEDESSNELRLSSIPKEESLNGHHMSYNKDAYITHCADYLSYQTWLKNRNTQRYVDIAEHGQKIDGKNLLHCYRLIETGIEIAKEKTINVRRPNAEFLIGIRKGKYNLEELLSKAEEKVKELESAYDTSDLPYTADRGFFLSLMVKIREKYYESQKS